MVTEIIVNHAAGLENKKPHLAGGALPEALDRLFPVRPDGLPTPCGSENVGLGVSLLRRQVEGPFWGFRTLAGLADRQGASSSSSPERRSPAPSSQPSGGRRPPSG